ncbi:ketopantoate reductase family protein [Cellulomonas sp. C5510]|uniref:ketopantoate reductase family protein n=1 Tax=Cellulomonas sp. C5510 TaxID=2871170 RepID=UPI00351CF3CB
MTLVARGRRLDQVSAGVRCSLRGAVESIELPVVDTVPSASSWDVARVCVRYDQVEQALHHAAPVDFPTIVTLINGPGDYEAWEGLVGPGRLLPGFPGAGGSIDPARVLHAAATPTSILRTTLGEISGRRTTRVVRLAGLLRQAGFPTALSSPMGIWRLTHLGRWSSPSPMPCTPQAGPATGRSPPTAPPSHGRWTTPPAMWPVCGTRACARPC